VREQRTIHSPINGVVVERVVWAGEYVDDKPLLRLAQLDPLHVEVILPVEYLGRITMGMQGRVTSILPNAKPLLATVERVDQVADAASGTYRVRMRIPNPKHDIPAGLRCRTRFIDTHGHPPESDREALQTALLNTQPFDTSKE
jgi:multidrug efflux pump subunit AcrA (membrane-fusion protein)